MIHVGYARHNAFPNQGAAEDHASFVEDLDNITEFNASLGSFGRMNPDRLVHVAVPTLDFAGEGFTSPGDIIGLGMSSPSGMVGNDQQGEDLGAAAATSFIMHFGLVFSGAGRAVGISFVNHPALGWSKGLTLDYARR